MGYRRSVAAVDQGRGIRSVTLPGLGRVRQVQRLCLVPDLELPTAVTTGAATD